MNSLWPASSRIFYRYTLSNPLQGTHRVESVVAKLSQLHARPCSIPPLPFWRNGRAPLKPNLWSRTYHVHGPRQKFQSVVRPIKSKEIITEYGRLPRTYKDEEGLQFRAEPLSQDEVKDIFGSGVDAKSANRLLAVLHGRRVAGTLEDPAILSTILAHEETLQERALKWLRKNVQVDEIASAGRRAEQELQNMAAEIIGDSERIGLLKPNSRKNKSVYGESGLDAIRAAKEREFEEKEEEKRRISQADEIQYNTGTLENVSATSSRVELRRPGENPKLKYYMERAKILPNTPPEMTKLQRLWPSGLLVLGVVVVSLTFTLVYKPPNNGARLWPDMPPAAATIISIIIANSLVLAAWRVPMLFRGLNKYFITVPGYPFSLSMVGNIFSHQSLSHFSINMLILWFVGVRLHDEIGRANFLAIYVSAGAIGSFTSLTSWVVRNSFISSSLGASGALCGVIATYLWLNKDQSVQFFGFLAPDHMPWVPASVVLAVLVGYEVFCLTKWNKAPLTLDHWAHFGGYMTGIGAAEILKRRAKRRREMVLEWRKNSGLLDKIKEGRL